MIDQPRQVGGGRRTIGDVAPKLAELTDDVLFEDVWNRPELSARDLHLPCQSSRLWSAPFEIFMGHSKRCGHRY